MNALKPALRATIETLLAKGVSQRRIAQLTRTDRKTIRRYARGRGPSHVTSLPRRAR